MPRIIHVALLCDVMINSSMVPNRYVETVILDTDIESINSNDVIKKRVYKRLGRDAKNYASNKIIIKKIKRLHELGTPTAPQTAKA